MKAKPTDIFLLNENVNQFVVISAYTVCATHQLIRSLCSTLFCSFDFILVQESETTLVTYKIFEIKWYKTCCCGNKSLDLKFQRTTVLWPYSLYVTRAIAILIFVHHNNFKWWHDGKKFSYNVKICHTFHWFLPQQVSLLDYLEYDKNI